MCATEVAEVGRSSASDSLVRVRKSPERAYGRERDGDERQKPDDRADQHRLAQAERPGERTADCSSERKRARPGGGREACCAGPQAVRDECLADTRRADAVQGSRNVLEDPAEREKDDRRIPRRDGEEESRRTEEKECRHDGPAHAQSLGHPSREDGTGESTDLAEGEHDTDDRGRQSELADGVDDHDRPHEPEREVGQRMPEQERTEVAVAEHVPPTLAELAARLAGAAMRDRRPSLVSRNRTDEARGSTE